MAEIEFKYVEIDRNNPVWSTRGIWDKAHYISESLINQVPCKITLEDQKRQIIEYFVFVYQSTSNTYLFFSRYKRKNK